ncbi:hypothetical protein ACEPPN_009721 [Leptodophora sp. 'Broadleaf-Isolate-01']
MSQKAITRKGDAQVLARYYPNVPLTPHISDLKRTTWNDSSSTLDGQTNISERTSFSSTRPLCSTPSLSSFKPGWQLYLSFSILSIVGLAASLDATSISPALPAITSSLNSSTIAAFWTGTSFRLAATVFQPSYATFSSIFGRKPLLLTALIFFTAGAIICGLAQDVTILLLGRCIQGIGAGGITTLTEIIVTDLVPLRSRGKWFSFIGAAVAIGTSVGPVVGGSLAEKVSWRFIFWINLPLCGIALATVPVLMKLPFAYAPLAPQLKRVDWVGSVLFICSITGFLIPITWGGILYPWRSWKVVVPLSLSSCGLAVFLLYEKFYASNPFIHLSMFNNRTAAITYLSTFLHGVILWTLIFYLPLYYEAVKGFTPTQAGIAVFPETFTVAPASLIMGLIVSRTGRYQFGVWTGWLLTTIGTGLLCLLGPETSNLSCILLNLVGGIGIGLLFSGMAFAIQASAWNSGEDMGFAIAMFCFLRALGTAVGVAISGTIFQNSLKTIALSRPLLAPHAQEYSQNAAELAHIIKIMPDGQLKIDTKQVYADALKVIWGTMCAVSMLGLAATFFTEEYSLDQPGKDEQFKEDVSSKKVGNC